MKLKLKTISAGAMALAAINNASAQTTPPAAPAPAPGTLNSFFNGKLPEAIGKSKISVNSRFRWEYADQSNLQTANAYTLRTRFGITTAPLFGFQGMLEAENVSSLGNVDDYNAGGSNPAGATKTIIADPPTTEINQAWLSYTCTNWMTTAKGGRERIVLDNARFVGDVGWRQNQQTFDAGSIESKPMKDLSLFYAYVWKVHRIFGNVPGLPAASANRDFDSASHLINVSYSPCTYAKFTGYTYLLDLKNGAGAANSCATYGGYVTGTIPAGKKVKLDYRAEYAYQTDYGDSLLGYQANYYNIELAANVKPFIVGGGYEVLGSDNNSGVAGGLASFRTPLATLHAFNGWADVFLATPPAGLRDIYGFAQVTIPKADLPIRFVYHKFDADKGGADFGQEFDVVATKKLGKNWTSIAKYAHYDGKSAPAAFDVDKFWLELGFNF